MKAIVASPRALTRRGALTRARIVEAAARRIHAQGARGTSLDEIMADSDTSKSQLYHYFASKDDLLHAVIELQTDRVMAAQSAHLDRLDSLAGLCRWRDLLVGYSRATSGVGGCPLGSLASELAEHSESARNRLVASFETWESPIVTGLRAMHARGDLATDADPDALATATMSALQGGLLLAQTRRSTRPLQLALDMAIAHIARYVIDQRGTAVAQAAD